MKKVKLFEQFVNENSSDLDELLKYVGSYDSNAKYIDDYKRYKRASDNNDSLLMRFKELSSSDKKKALKEIDKKFKGDSDVIDAFKRMDESVDNGELITEGKIRDFLKSSRKFFNAIAIEGKETAQAFGKIYRNIAKGEELSDKEMEEIGEQLKDALRTVGLTAIAVLPGGAIVALIIKALKAERFFIPSNLKYLIEK